MQPRPPTHYNRVDMYTDSTIAHTDRDRVYKPKTVQLFQIHLVSVCTHARVVLKHTRTVTVWIHVQIALFHTHLVTVCTQTQTALLFRTHIVNTGTASRTTIPHSHRWTPRASPARQEGHGRLSSSKTAAPDSALASAAPALDIRTQTVSVQFRIELVLTNSSLSCPNSTFCIDRHTSSFVDSVGYV